RVVSLAAHARMAVARVERVVEQGLAVRPNVQHDGNHAGRVDAGGRGVHGELADRDVDPADAPVANAQDLLRVGGHDQVDVVRAQAGRGEGGLHRLEAVDGQVDAAGVPVLVAVALDGLADGRVVDDRHHLLQVARQQGVE